MRKIEDIMATFIEQGMQTKCSVTKKIGQELNKSRCYLGMNQIGIKMASFLNL